MIKERNKIEVVYKGGGTLVSLPPVFSKNGSYLYVAKPFNIASYNVQTGNKITEFSRVNSKIVGFDINYVNDEEHVIACTKNGCIILWKTISGLKLREIKTNLSHVVHFKTITKFDEDNNQITNVLICSENTSKNKYDFSITNLQTNETNTINLKVKIKSQIHVDVSSTGSFIVAVQESTLYYYRLDINVFRRHLINGRTFTFVRCHPTDDVILTGDNTGRIVIWENLLDKSPAQAVYHWHTLPMKTACFSSSGTQYYSGGSECVLVKWIPNNNHQNFLPRLSGFIEHISITKDNQFIALSTSDNAIYIVTPQLKIKTTIQHLVVSNGIITDLVYDLRSKSLVFNGISGHVQFFSPKNLDLIHSLDVAGKNKYTDERNVVIVNSCITHVDIDKTGLWMATVEERKDPEVSESRLKFWFYDETKQNFILNTAIEYPHEGFVNKLLFQPSNNEHEVYCVTIGSDLKFKLWQVVPIKTVYREGFVWECASEISYRNLTPNVSSFSSDGSLLAVGFNSIITTWLPDNCELKCSLRHPIQEDDLYHVSFGTDSQCHLLCSATKSFICVWNLLNLSIAWSVQVDVLHVVSDVMCSYKAVFTTDKKLFVFDLNSPNPVFVMKKLKNVSDVASAAFVPKSSTTDVNRWDRRLSIFILTSNFELFAVESPESELNENSLHIKEDHSFFKNMLPEIRNALLKDNSQNQMHSYSKDLRGKKLQQLLDTPVPSLQLSFLCEDILADSLIQGDPELPKNDADDGPVKEIDRASEEKVNKLFDKNESLSEICDEKMLWTSVLL